jgi:Family of unknown function (DUF6279)
MLSVMPISLFSFSYLRALASGTARIIGALLLVWLLGACSAIKIAYNQSPELIYFWLDGQLDFSSAQSLKVRDDLASLHEWHRRTQLLVYVELLRNIEQKMTVSLTANEVCAFVDDARDKLDAVINQAEPAIVATAINLSPTQIRHLEQRNSKANTEWREKWLDANPSSLAKLRLTQYEDRLEMLYGKLTDTQRERLREVVQAARFDGTPGYRERLRRQRETVETLQSVMGGKLPLAQSQALVHAYLRRSLTSPDPAYREHLNGQIQAACELVSRVHNMTTAEQRATAIKRLQAYQRTARELLTVSR